MSRAAIDNLAEAIKDALNAQTFSAAFTATRTRRPERTIEQLKTLTVLVVPAATATNHHTRGLLEDEHKIDVAVLQKLADVDGEDEADAIAYLLYEIKDFLIRRTLSALKATCTAIAAVDGAAAGYSPEHLREMGVYTGVVRSTWLMERTLA